MASVELQQFFSDNLVEVKSIRRNPPPPPIWGVSTRRFICTNNRLLLNSIAGKSVFHFKPPTQLPSYDTASRNLLTVFDLFVQGYRNINLDYYKILGALPLKNEEDIRVFWDYYYKHMKPLNSNDKINIMNR